MHLHTVHTKTPSLTTSGVNKPMLVTMTALKRVFLHWLGVWRGPDTIAMWTSNCRRRHYSSQASVQFTPGVADDPIDRTPIPLAVPTVVTNRLSGAATQRKVAR